MIGLISMEPGAGIPFKVYSLLSGKESWRAEKEDLVECFKIPQTNTAMAYGSNHTLVIPGVFL